MKRQITSIVCDQCTEPREQAVVTCEVHATDLCERHMRKHFDKSTCRLIPVDREPTTGEKTDDTLDALGETLKTRAHAVEGSAREMEGTPPRGKRMSKEDSPVRFYWTINGVPVYDSQELLEVMRQNLRATASNQYGMHGRKEEDPALRERASVRCGHATRESAERDAAKFRAAFPNATIEIIEGQFPYSR